MLKEQAHDAELLRHADLPEMPETVVVPDDLSGLELPERPRRAAAAVRWLRWIPVVLALVAGAVAVVLLTRSTGDELDIDAYDRVELNRVEIAKDLAWMSSYDRVEMNRVEIVRDLAPMSSYDRVELNRVEIAKDLANGS